MYRVPCLRTKPYAASSALACVGLEYCFTAISLYIDHMKTTIDLPEEILHRAKIVAAQRRTTLKELVISGLDHELGLSGSGHSQQAAVARLRKGVNLGGQPLARADLYARH
jgi:hypothetical protein